LLFTGRQEFDESSLPQSVNLGVVDKRIRSQRIAGTESGRHAGVMKSEP
jgi:hypothetical protein